MTPAEEGMARVMVWAIEQVFAGVPRPPAVLIADEGEDEEEEQ